ncbi:MAG TPA: thermonuclease family protein [Rickettsiales bacterium]|nr:thermonuclease family protein [Rickettsiales bacterium]
MMESALQVRNPRFRILHGLFIYCFLLLPALAAQAQEEIRTVKSVINGKSFITDSGETVRLAGIEAPNAQEANTPSHHGRLGEPLGDEAKQTLSSLILSRKVRIQYAVAKPDRHNRILAQVYDMQGHWIQGAMLEAGMAMTYSFTDTPSDVIEKMLAAEHKAQRKNIGLWANPYYRIITPQETAEFINRFKLVEGKVVSINHYHGHIYINFSEYWKGNFAVFVSQKYASAFTDKYLQSLTGSKVRVRGWIHYYHAPMMDITHPEQIEIIH